MGGSRFNPHISNCKSDVRKIQGRCRPLGRVSGCAQKLNETKGQVPRLILFLSSFMRSLFRGKEKNSDKEEDV